MAEETEEEAEVEAPPRPAASPSRYFLLILIILLLEAAGGYFLLDRAIPAPDEGPKVEAKDEEAKEEWKAPLFYEKITQLVFSPVDSRGHRLVQLSLALEVEPKAVLGEIEKKHQIIWDLILQRLETFPLDAVRESEKKAIREDLMRALNAELKNGQVTAIYFTELVTQ